MQNGIILLSFPPHCSHKLQPLDRSVYGPLKKCYNTACNSWMKLNPGKKMSIHDIPSMVRTAFPLATTQNNIQSGFKCSEIWPFNPDVFEEHEYAPSQVTTPQAPAHEELPSEAHDSSSNIATSQQLTAPTEHDLDSGTLLGANTDISSSTPSLSSALASNQHPIFSSESLRPIPQAAATSSDTQSTGAVLYTELQTPR